MPFYLYYNPLDEKCKNVRGAISEGKSLQLTIFCYQKAENASVTGEKYAPDQDAFLCLCKDGAPMQRYAMQKTEDGWTICLKIHEVGLYFYHFYVQDIGYLSANYKTEGVLGKRIEENFLLTVYKKDYTTPDWFKGGTMYQIFPDRFAKSGSMPDITGRIRRDDWGGTPTFRPNEYGKVLNNDFFGGNFKGVQEKLPYLKKLGVSVLYFNPIFEAASNHRYDTSDYLKIDPYLGTKEDFEQLVEAAKNQGISVVLDGVFNHTGDDSVYFNKYGHYSTLGAYQSKDSPYYSWYCFDNFPEKYSSWWGIDILPQLNENSLEYQNFVFGEKGVLKTWLQCGIGGYRLDVADELPDFFLKKLRDSVKSSNPDAIIIGEVWEDASNKVAYSQRREYLQGRELDSVMNYPLKDGIIRFLQTNNTDDLLITVRKLIDHYPKQTLDCLMNILGTHDTSRILTVLGGIYCHNKEEMASDKAFLTPKNKEIALEKLKIAALLQYTLPGVPCLYYGDENGMEGHVDPFCRRCFDWNNLNQELIAYYQLLGKIRKNNQKYFKDGDFEEVFVEKNFLVFARRKGSESIYVFVNRSSKPTKLQLDGVYEELLSKELAENQFVVKGYAYGILKKRKTK